MANYKDPLRTLSFELPAGWAYDPLQSSLTDLFFARWDRPEETLVVHLRRTCASEDQSDDQWIDRIKLEIEEKGSLFDMDAAGGRAIASDFGPPEGMAQRVAFVRGPYVDIAVEQRNADRNAPDPWEALIRSVRTVLSEANQAQPDYFIPEKFEEAIRSANIAFNRQDALRVVEGLEDSIKIGTSLWLSSLTVPDRAPEINVAVRMAQAMVHLGNFTQDLFLKRDAVSIFRRALRSLDAAGKEQAEDAQALTAEIKETLDIVELEFLGKANPEINRNNAPIISVRERGFLAAQMAANGFDKKDFKNACRAAGAAIEDFLFLLSYFRRARTQPIPEDTLKQLVAHGITDPEEQRDVIREAGENVLFAPLNLSLQIRYCCAMEDGDYEEAADAVEILVPLARLIVDSTPDGASIVLNLALALMDEVGVIAALQDKGRLKNAGQLMEEAKRILNSTEGECNPRDGWVRNHKHQIEKSLEALNQWLEASRKSGDASCESDLQPLRSEFEATASQLQFRITQPYADFL